MLYRAQPFQPHFPPSYDNHAPELLHAPRYIPEPCLFSISSKSDDRDQSYARKPGVQVTNMFERKRPPTGRPTDITLQA